MTQSMDEHRLLHTHQHSAGGVHPTRTAASQPTWCSNTLPACSLLENFALNMESGPGAAGGGAGAHGGGGGCDSSDSDSDSDVGLGERTASFVKAEVRVQGAV